jgi:hypothetical protein
MERSGSRNFPVCSRGSAECPLWIPPKNGWTQTAPRVTAAPAERKPLNVFPRKIQPVAGKPLSSLTPPVLKLTPPLPVE